MRRTNTSRSSSSSYLGFSGALSPTCRTPTLRKPSDISQTRCSTALGASSTPSSPRRAPVQSAAIGALQGRDLVEKVRGRFGKKEEKVTPQQAADVVRSYILPLFEADARLTNDRLRGGSLGLSAKQYILSATGNTVYSELKLSSNLLTDLETLKSQLRTLQQELAYAKVAQASAEAELQQYQTKLTQAEIKFQFATKSQTELARSYQTNFLSTCFLGSQLRQLQETYRTEEEKCKHYAALLQEERSKNDKLRNQTAELEYSSSLLRMENDIMGERLKGLYVSIDHLAGTKFAEEFIRTEYAQIAGCMAQFLKEGDMVHSEMGKALKLKDEYVGDNMEINALRKEALSEKNKLAKVSRDRIQMLQASLQSAEEERDKLKLELVKQEKHFIDLSDEFTKLRAKVKQYRQKRKAYGEAEEKICKKCQRVYLENENYNWSCRTHQSEFGGDIWWCCGKSGRDAVGCKVSKHEGREEEDEEENLEKKEEEELRLALQKCPSCKHYGHGPHECPKDPNFRSKFELGDEMMRVTKLMGSKQKHSLPSPEFSTLALNVLGTRSNQDDFNNENAASSHQSSIFSDEEMDEEGQESGFREIRDLKSRMIKRQTTVSVHQFITKDFEKEMSVSKHYKSLRKTEETISAPVSPSAGSRSIRKSRDIGTRLM